MKELAELCIKCVGGARNIKSVSRCATRPRLMLMDQNKVDEAALMNIAGVMKVMQVGAQTQIVIGSNAPELYGVASKMIDAEKSGGAVFDDEYTAQDKRQKWTQRHWLANFLTPAAACLRPWFLLLLRLPC